MVVFMADTLVIGLLLHNVVFVVFIVMVIVINYFVYLNLYCYYYRGLLLAN